MNPLRQFRKLNFEIKYLYTNCNKENQSPFFSFYEKCNIKIHNTTHLSYSLRPEWFMKLLCFVLYFVPVRTYFIYKMNVNIIEFWQNSRIYKFGILFCLNRNKINIAENWIENICAIKKLKEKKKRTALRQINWADLFCSIFILIVAFNLNLFVLVYFYWSTFEFLVFIFIIKCFAA